MIYRFWKFPPSPTGIRILRQYPSPCNQTPHFMWLDICLTLFAGVWPRLPQHTACPQTACLAGMCCPCALARRSGWCRAAGTRPHPFFVARRQTTPHLCRLSSNTRGKGEWTVSVVTHQSSPGRCDLLDRLVVFDGHGRPAARSESGRGLSARGLPGLRSPAPAGDRRSARSRNRSRTGGSLEQPGARHLPAGTLRRVGAGIRGGACSPGTARRRERVRRSPRP